MLAQTTQLCYSRIAYITFEETALNGDMRILASVNDASVSLGEVVVENAVFNADARVQAENCRTAPLHESRIGVKKAVPDSN
jgi:hypothetical protein